MNDTPKNEQQSFVPEYPKIYIPDYTRELKFLNKQVQEFLKSDHQQQIDASMQRIESKIDSMPKVIPVRHHHHFEIRSVAFLVTFGLMLLSFVTAYFFYNGKQELKQANEEMRSDTLSYFLVKAYYPDVAKTLDKGFYADPVGFTNKAHELMEARPVKKSNNNVNQIKHRDER